MLKVLFLGFFIGCMFDAKSTKNIYFNLVLFNFGVNYIFLSDNLENLSREEPFGLLSKQ